MLRQVLFDPFQMAAVSQRLAKAHVPMEEISADGPQPDGGHAEPVRSHPEPQLVLYSDAAMRLAVSRAIIVESRAGWRLDKLKQQHKIDVVVALSMACLAAVRGQGKPGYDLFHPGLFDDNATISRLATSVIGASWARIFMPVLEFGRDEPH